ncbi:hypothetical protein KIW84_071091 [Lathyrus oleraceus]|uniref:Endonuclease/exonuclease/phosphatase family protein n=1 Tax=Pisum sativum TaxID=3888 RepID=A0A9D4VHX2_PEA|nr:hypothetical protein KIW84_071091 [Pisum sativum]
MVREIRNMLNTHWCIIGDFNDLLTQQDNQGIHPHPKWLCVGFRQAVTDYNLADIPIEGHQFTWIKSKWTDHVVEEPSHLNHSPIFLHYDLGQQKRRKYAFKFENYWLKEDNIENVVQNGWLHGENHDVMHHIASCEEELEKWNKRQYRQKKYVLERLKDIMERSRRNQDVESQSWFLEAPKEYNKLLIKEDTYWK